VYDLWLRLQRPDGAVPSAIESIEHPSEPSWLLGQPTAVTPPMPATCQLWAAAAAQMSIVLEKYDPARAKLYRDSALRAMEWAEKNPQVPNVFGNAKPATAAVWLYRLTGDEKWHEAFKAAFERAQAGTPGADKADVGLAGRAYALMPEDKTDPELRRRCRDAILKDADAKIARTGRWTWHVGPQRYDWDERLGQTGELAVAHRLTGDAKYVRAMEQQAQFALGLNPTNASYTSGLGTRQVVIFNLEARYLGSPYPHGITTYGPAPRNIWRGTSIEKALTAAGIHPEWKHWPWAESTFNVRIANITEYTVGSMGNILLTRAYLAQHYAAPPK
jgi:endoglucanase